MEQEIFRQVPFLPGLKCSADGRFFAEDTGEEVPTTINGYMAYYSLYWFGNTHFCHRLLAMAWMPVPEQPYEELQVNHKDGNKLNNNVDNLEWVTASQNRLHALEQGMAPAVAVLRKDLRTGEIVRFLSINECARQIGVSPATVINYIESPDKVRKMFYVFVREGNEWPDLTADDIGKDRKGLPTIVKMINLTTNEVHLGKTMAAAADLIGVRADTLYVWVRNNSGKGRNYHGWSVEFMTDPVVLMRVLAEIPKETNSTRGRRKQFGYVVTNIVTNETRNYQSADELCSVIGINRNNLRCIMSRNKGIWKNLKMVYAHSVHA